VTATRIRACAWRLVLAGASLAAALNAGSASAQTTISGSISMLSEYRYRGLALSDGKAAAQLNLNLDHASGWYGGGFLTNSSIADIKGAQLIGYAGYAQRLHSGASWEAGCTRTAYTQWHSYDYNECYAGAALERVSARLYYAPDYLGRNARTAYAELNGFYPLQDGVSVIGHAGWLRTLSGLPYPGIPASSRYDARLGISMRLGDWNAQLVRSSTQSEPGYYGTQSRPTQLWILSAVYAF
jgi:uncharacterized protein (TIGR02001 family)